MKTIMTALLLASAALGQGIDNYDTTVTLMAATPDSFYIYPIKQYLYFNALTTASCPSHTSADFVQFVPPNYNTNVERIPSQAYPLIQVTAHCAGSEATGIKAEKIFSTGNRYYKIKTDGIDIYFRVTEISNDYKARIEFSYSPFSTGIINTQQNANTRIRSEILNSEAKGRNYLINGKNIQNSKRNRRRN